MHDKDIILKTQIFILLLYIFLNLCEIVDSVITHRRTKEIIRSIQIFSFAHNTQFHSLINKTALQNS